MRLWKKRCVEYKYALSKLKNTCTLKLYFVFKYSYPGFLRDNQGQTLKIKQRKVGPFELKFKS